MTTTSSANGSVSSVVNSPISKQVVRTKLTANLKANFATTLGQAQDIVNIVMALMYKESTFRTDAKGPQYSKSTTDKIVKYSAVAQVYKNGSPQQQANIFNSAAAFGLGQVTGYYCVKGCGPSGKAELERMRPDLCGPIMVSPGADVKSTLIGDANIDNQITACLIVLEDKWKNVAPAQVSSGAYSDRLTASVAAYLGLGTSDSLGTTPQAYADSIIRGSAYNIANNGVGVDGRPLIAGSTGVTNSTTTTGAIQTAASGNNLSPPGC